jgi:hypothetical protein
MTARLLMIALDAADSRLLEEGIIADAFPNLAALSAHGRVKRLIVPYDTDDALWASFQYGIPVGEHGTLPLPDSAQHRKFRHGPCRGGRPGAFLEGSGKPGPAYRGSGCAKMFRTSAFQWHPPRPLARPWTLF